MSIETDFYKLESHEAEENLLNILSKPLWICNFLIFYKSNEDQLIDQAKEQIYMYRLRARAEKFKEIKLQEAVDDAHAFFKYAVPCIPEGM